MSLLEEGFKNLSSDSDEDLGPSASKSPNLRASDYGESDQLTHLTSDEELSSKVRFDCVISE